MTTKEGFQQLADQLIRDAEAAGIDITIRLQPLEPLAMGNHKMIAEVTPHHAY